MIETIARGNELLDLSASRIGPKAGQRRQRDLDLRRRRKAIEIDHRDWYAKFVNPNNSVGVGGIERPKHKANQLAGGRGVVKRTGAIRATVKVYKVPRAEVVGK